MTDVTDPEQAKSHLFKPGQSGNPAGRPKGSRSKLSEDFLKALVEDFNSVGEDGKTQGIVAIREMRQKSPGDYSRMIAGLMPKELTGEDGGPIITEIRRTSVRPRNQER